MLPVEKKEFTLSAVPGEVLAILTSTEMLVVYSVTLLLFAITSLYRGLDNTCSLKTASGIAGNLGIFVFNALMAPVIMIAVNAMQTLYAAIGIPQLPSELWIGMPVFLVAAISIVVQDFADYWNHRIMHMKWVWPIHAIHHSDEAVNGLTALRVHFLELIFMRCSYIVLLSWLGMPPQVAAAGVLLMVIHDLYIHADLDWDHGPLRYIIASPRFHRWHHADCPKAYGKNLANVVPLYDVMFGTYYNPHPCRERVGAEGVPHGDFIRLLTYPFVEWAAMLEKNPLL